MVLWSWKNYNYPPASGGTKNYGSLTTHNMHLCQRSSSNEPQMARNDSLLKLTLLLGLGPPLQRVVCPSCTLAPHGK